MKKLTALLWFACVCVGLVLADSPRVSFRAPLNDPTDVAAVKQVEQEMGDAMVAVDIDKLNQIYADDFADIGSDGKITIKKDLLNGFQSLHDKLESYELGPMDVQVLGNAAVAHGSVKEKRNRNGKDTSGEFVWMDLLKKRDGKWAVVRSGGARVVDSSRAPLNDPTDVAAVKQVERDMGDAMVAVDIDKLNQIYADDWAIVGISGKIVTKEKVLHDFKSGEDKLVSYELGPMDVQVLGNAAVCHASVTEKRIRDGKDDSGEGVWMDLLEKRAGKWVVVRSGAAFVK